MRRPAAVVVVVVAVVVALAFCGCDSFDRKQGEAKEVESKDPRVRSREALTATVKAAAAVTATCVAGSFWWEEEATEEAGPKHYSRPCISERCAPPPADIEALQASVRGARKLVDDHVDLQVPSVGGAVSLAEAMVAFIETSTLAAKSEARAEAPTFSGLSMHYGSLVAAFAKLYDEPAFPAEPPSLTASLTAPGVGGDVCAGWGNPKYCDVTAIELPATHRWRASPACIEVDSVKKPR